MEEQNLEKNFAFQALYHFKFYKSQQISKGRI